MERDIVESSVVRSAGFEVCTFNVHNGRLAQMGTMEIEFHNGNVVRYHNVPRYQYTQIRISQSIGSALARFVKSSGCRYEGIAGPSYDKVVAHVGV